MTTVTNYPIDLPILVIEAQIFVAVNKFQFLPNKLIPSAQAAGFGAGGGAGGAGHGADLWLDTGGGEGDHH